MKKNTTSKARLSARKVRIKNLARGLTSQAGLIPVVKFLDRLGFCGLADEDVGHQRGENAVYTLTDVVLVTTVGIVGGAASLRERSVSGTSTSSRITMNVKIFRIAMELKNLSIALNITPLGPVLSNFKWVI